MGSTSTTGEEEAPAFVPSTRTWGPAGGAACITKYITNRRFRTNPARNWVRGGRERRLDIQTSLASQNLGE